MSDQDDDGHEDPAHDGHEDHGDHAHDSHGSELVNTRVTSPMQEFGTSQVTTGLVVFAVGLVVVFGVPLLLA
jgi:hypothetical protein